MTELGAPIDDGFCFGCGRYSQTGLHMEFAIEADRGVTSRLTIARAFAGWRGVAHGGIVALLLDEAMAYAAGAHGVRGITADLKMRFRKAVPLETPLLVHGRVVWQRRNVLGTTATVERDDGTLLASGEGRFIARGVLVPGERLGA